MAELDWEVAIAIIAIWEQKYPGIRLSFGAGWGTGSVTVYLFVITQVQRQEDFSPPHDFYKQIVNTPGSSYLFISNLHLVGDSTFVLVPPAVS